MCGDHKKVDNEQGGYKEVECSEWDKKTERDRQEQKCRGINHWSTTCQMKDKNISRSPLGTGGKEHDERDASKHFGTVSHKKKVKRGCVT